jgi:hypothetical protein
MMVMRRMTMKMMKMRKGLRCTFAPLTKLGDGLLEVHVDASGHGGFWRLSLRRRKQICLQMVATMKAVKERERESG